MDGKPGVNWKSKTSLEISFTYRKTPCRVAVKAVHRTDKQNERYAYQLLCEINRKIEKGTFVFSEYFPTHPLAKKFEDVLRFKKLSSALLDWINSDSTKDRLAQTTWKTYNRTIIRMIGLIGDVTVGEFDKGMILKISDEMDVTQKTLNNNWLPVKQFFKWASPRHDIVDPFYGLHLQARKKTKKPDIDPFTYDEILKLSEKADDQTKNIIHLVYWSGLRPQEWMALKWSDIDWIHKKIHIQRAVSTGIEKETKTEAGHRVIDMLEEAERALIGQKKHTFMASEYVFMYTQWKSFTHDQEFRDKIWAPLCKRAKVRYRPPKQLRHSFASTAILSGEDVYWTSEMLGHTDPALTLKVYYRYIQSMKKHAGERMKKSVGNSVKTMVNEGNSG